MFRNGRRPNSKPGDDHESASQQISALLPRRNSQLLADRPRKLVVYFLMPRNGTLLAIVRKVNPAAVLRPFR